MGHQHAKATSLASDSNLHSDVKIITEQDTFCATCKISTVRSENRGPPAEERNIEPGQVLHIDVQPNVAKQSLAERDTLLAASTLQMPRAANSGALAQTALHPLMLLIQLQNGHPKTNPLQNTLSRIIAMKHTSMLEASLCQKNLTPGACKR